MVECYLILLLRQSAGRLVSSVVYLSIPGWCSACWCGVGRSRMHPSSPPGAAYRSTYRVHPGGRRRSRGVGPHLGPRGATAGACPGWW